jgi:hypothetical protein
MALKQSMVITQSINSPARDLYCRFWKPESFTRWASGPQTFGLQKDHLGWKFLNPPTQGEFGMTFTEYNTFGVMDHTVELDGKQVVFAPMRVVPNGEGCDVQVTLFRQPCVEDERFEQDQMQIRKDLVALKTLAESA